jgi:hypothetical protein
VSIFWACRNWPRGAADVLHGAESALEPAVRIQLRLSLHLHPLDGCAGQDAVLKAAGLAPTHGLPERVQHPPILGVHGIQKHVVAHRRARRESVDAVNLLRPLQVAPRQFQPPVADVGDRLGAVQVAAAFQQRLFGLLALHHLPGRVHQQGKLQQIGLFVGFRLVGHPDHRHQASRGEDRHRQKAADRHVPRREASVQRAGGLAVVDDNGLPLTRSLSEQARLVQPVGSLRVAKTAVGLGLAGIRVQGELGPLLAVEVDAAVSTAREGQGLLDRIVEQL